MAQKYISHTLLQVFRRSVKEKVLGITDQQLLSYGYFGDIEYLKLLGEVIKHSNETT
jgi:hypothetical protein